LYSWGTQIFKNSKSHLKILGARKVTWSKYHTEYPKILDATVQNLAVRAIWRLRFVYPCCTISTEVLKQHVARKSNGHAISQRSFCSECWVEGIKNEREKEKKTERRKKLRKFSVFSNEE
jgi:hypothetical protein